MPMLVLLALAWMLVGPCAVIVPDNKKDSSGVHEPESESQAEAVGLRSLASTLWRGGGVSAAILAFTICLSPTLDFFLFRQNALGWTASQQTFVSLAGSMGWFLGTTVYRHLFAPGRTARESLRMCLMIWPIAACFSTFVAASAMPGAISTFALVSAEKAAAEFCKALTFMPCTVMMQLHAPKGSESSAFTVMQLGGTLGSVIARNIEFYFTALAGVSPTTGYDYFWQAAGLSAIWRIITAVMVLVVLPLAPSLGLPDDAASKSK
eukprot:TRINITY_DN14102_c0_g1_i3.p1 TRINITY_DN14102_c0_g1~~TRINITY_DN14102_c0_g1_i3.p1  ORF type:complete len:265 (+),score=35.36 TRINITY_DN14102_c0_g1_i3:283-1077(+)